MKVLIDTNIILDLLMARMPFAQDAVQIFQSASKKEFTAYISATSLATVDYLYCRETKKRNYKKELSTLLQINKLATIDQKVADYAINSAVDDFEDALINASAVKSGCAAIVTRDTKDFKKSKLKIYTPKEFLKILG